MEEINWQVQKLCADSGDYELNVEKQKTDWECEQKRESWKWSISYHGSITASGVCNSLDDAKEKANLNIPK